MPMPRKPEPEKYCPVCKARMIRKRMSGRLEDLAQFTRRKYCDRKCMAKGLTRKTVSKSMHHKRARKFIMDFCETCRTDENLAVHHIDNDPTNNERSNLMTLCGSCHTHWHWEHGKKAIPRSNHACRVCGQPARKLRMCQKHYQRFRKYGDPCLTKKWNGSSFQLTRDSGTQSGPESLE